MFPVPITFKPSSFPSIPLGTQVALQLVGYAFDHAAFVTLVAFAVIFPVTPRVLEARLCESID